MSFIPQNSICARFNMSSVWLLGGRAVRPTSQHRETFALNTCDSNSLPLLTDWIITPSLYENYTPHPWLGGSATWLGLANGRWVVVMLVGSCVQCACSWLALLCSCDPLWEELVPQSHCPFSLSLRVKLQGTNLPEVWSPTWPSLHQPSQKHQKRDLVLYAIEILRYFITRQKLTNAPLLVRLWENYLSHHLG